MKTHAFSILVIQHEREWLISSYYRFAHEEMISNGHWTWEVGESKSSLGRGGMHKTVFPFLLSNPHCLSRSYSV
jgi:hypothetical protein